MRPSAHSCRVKMSWRLCAVRVCVLLLMMVGISLVISQVFQTRIQSRLKREVTLAEKSKLFEAWKKPPPVYLEYYFFNVTNPQVFVTGGKAVVKQIGPYTYREYTQRENVTFLENGAKVSVLNRKRFVFVPEKSCGDPEVDVITTVNIPAMSVMSTVWQFYKASAMNFLYGKYLDIFITRTVHEMLWGYKDPLLDRLSKTKPEVEEHFGLMWKKNETHEGEFVFHTGKQNYMDHGKIDTWNGLREMTWWSSNQSNMINGTDGTVFHPLLSRTDLLYIFSPDLCRSVHLGYVEDVVVKGVRAYRFAPSVDVLQSPTENPANQGFCVPGRDCLGTGLLDVSVCREFNGNLPGRPSPMVMSLPHFYQADPKYINAIDGLNPNKEEHESYLDIQPTTGVPIRTRKRTQLNIILKRLPGFRQTRHFINETIFPIMFVSEMSTIDDESASQMRTQQLAAQKETKYGVTLTEKSKQFEAWKKPPPVYLEYYFFNVTNPQVFVAGGKAAVKQIGPYTYRGYMQRGNVKFLDRFTKVSALNHKRFVFVPEKSCGDPKVDLITTVNIPFMTVMSTVPVCTRSAMSWFYERPIDIFMTRTVHEVLWGYKDPLLSTIHKNKPEVDEHFGLMWKKNETHEGEFVFHTGKQNYMDHGKIDTWNGLREMTWWSSSQSNMINGTDGTVFHPLLSRKELLYIFSPDLCRSVHLGYVEDVEVKGVRAYRFAPSVDVLQSPTENPANQGFCVPGRDCLGTGLLDVGVCREFTGPYGSHPSPTVMSLPHFYQADPKYINAIEGLNPNKEEHESYLDIQPTTGVPIRTRKRTQLNFILKELPGLAQTKHFINETIFPIMFVSEMSTIDDESASQMRTQLIGEVFEAWENPPPVYLEYYFFNVTNPQVFLAGGKAAVKQIGPYTYREYTQRENVTFLENGTKVSVLNRKRFVFVPEKSCGDPEVDVITTVNIPLMDVMNKLTNYLRMVITMHYSSYIDMFVTHTVHEVLWGYKDPLLSKLHETKPEVEEHFGLMWKKNETHEGEFVFHTGKQNYMDHGKIDTWNGLREMTWWSSNQSNMINGTDGTIFHTLLSRKELLYIFSPDLCRSVHLGYVEDVVVKGIQAYRFAPSVDVLQSPTENPANQGFCVPGRDCLGTGLLDVGVCREFGSTYLRSYPSLAVMSLPHFYQADPKYINAVEGLKPNKEEHESYLDIQPTTGVPIRTRKRTQLNIIMKRLPGFHLTRHFINETIFPIMFVSEMSTIDESEGAQKEPKDGHHNMSTIDDESASQMRTQLLAAQKEVTEKSKELFSQWFSERFEAWKKPPPVYLEYYFFNVTNPQVFVTGGKAAVKQIGPYTYREYTQRENVTFLENGAKVSALNRKRFVFVPEKSCGDPEVDVITTVNIPAVTVMSTLRSFFHKFFVRLKFGRLLDMFITRTVHEVLWGYKDPLLSGLHEINPEVEVDEHFGLMWKRNETHEGEFVFHTGEQNYMDHGKIDTWNGLREMTWWSSNQSNMINGTDGTVFHPLLSRTDLLYIFSPDLCRSVHLGYVEDVEVKGIQAYRFAPSVDVLQSPTENPANQGFCVPGRDCLGTGLLDVGVCREFNGTAGSLVSPTVMSLPHFYQADPKYINAIDGLNPNKEEHESYLDIQPTTGVPIRTRKRTQLNILLKELPGLHEKEHSINKTIFPIMFVSEMSTIDDESASQMRTQLLAAQKETKDGHHNEVTEKSKELFSRWSSERFEAWKKPPPVYLEYYFFNVTNPQVFVTGGKAAVKQIGPYTYREYTQRENVTFLENGAKVSALNRKRFVFVPEKSCGDPEVDVITTVNIPAMTVMSTVSQFYQASPMNFLYGKYLDIFVTRTVHEMLWGYKDPLLDRLSKTKPEVEEHFGLMWKKNETHEGEFVFHTGKLNYMDHGKIDTWNGLREMTWWSSNQSNMINGTDGTVFHPLLSRKELLYIFSPDLCRSIHLGYVEDVEVKGIQAYRFAPSVDVLQSPTENPANQGFCVPGRDCLGTGLLDVGVCREFNGPRGSRPSPTVMSLPHFYQADPKYINAIDGLNPNKEEHESYLDIQPTTGVPIRTRKRTQLNIILKRLAFFPITKHIINETIFPIMFISEMSTISDESASQMRTQLLEAEKETKDGHHNVTLDN